jgi:hypothetical protein
MTKRHASSDIDRLCITAAVFAREPALTVLHSMSRRLHIYTIVKYTSFNLNRNIVIASTRVPASILQDPKRSQLVEFGFEASQNSKYLLNATSNQPAISRPHLLRDQSPPIACPRTLVFGEYPLIRAEASWIMEVYGMIERHHHAHFTSWFSYTSGCWFCRGRLFVTISEIGFDVIVVDCVFRSFWGSGRG